jgi:predicted GNAT family acetyltransferase
MEYLLDNPIYFALKTNHQSYSIGNETACFYRKDMANFAGLKEYDNSRLMQLFEMSEHSMLHILFSPACLTILAPWKVIKHINMFQMVYECDDKLELNSKINIEDLKQENVLEMMNLIELTQPGPFLINTILLGNYTGIFVDGKLAAMAGHRFHVSPYIEISAVCTHPDFLGKGFAYEIIKEQIRRIYLKSQIPFLHVRQDNTSAIKLYEKLGFTIRKAMYAVVISKQ